ncbi:MAG: hypothetical protein OEO19_18785 [Gammaproteobacteria bacterium]|nr:hypothetical protein [Gammaproteobacteria bacterium]MDH3447608.1 hypothetical protein [Gammaproteobacteria bacterium]
MRTIYRALRQFLLINDTIRFSPGRERAIKAPAANNAAQRARASIRHLRDLPAARPIPAGYQRGFRDPGLRVAPGMAPRQGIIPHRVNR